MIVLIIVALLIISFLLALYSLRGQLNRRELDQARKELEKGRVIYQDSSVSSSSESSS